jgi:apolipoprotein N-acyltransferase
MATLQPLIWLALGGLLLVFISGKWIIPLAPWLAMLFLLHFSRSQTLLASCLGVWLAYCVAIAIANKGVIKLPALAFWGVVVLISSASTIPFVIDRLLSPHLPGLVSTLVFPLTYVLVEWISGRFNPFGTWGSLAYSQYGNRPMMQLASVTGLWGITFLIAWFGSMGTWVWTNSFLWGVVQTEVLVYATLWSLVMLAGGARLAFNPFNTKTVRVAGIGWPEGVLDRSIIDKLIVDDSLSREELDLARQKLHAVYQRLLEESRDEARAGAKIVAWTEASTIMLAEDSPSWIEEAQQLSKAEGIHLLMGVGVIHRDRPQPRADNLAILITPQGDTAFTYTKAHEIPPYLAVTLLGKGQILTHDSPYGRIAAAICFDLDFPGYVRQVSQARSDIFIAPYGDWETIKNLHADMAAFRAVENGVSLIRPARGGVSTAVDPFGRILAAMDEFTAEQRILVAQVPVSGVRTIYALAGDWFAWSSALGLLAVLVFRLLH